MSEVRKRSSNPRLKPGVERTASGYLGFQTHGLRLLDDESQRVAAALNGTQSPLEIAQNLGVELERVVRIEEALASAGLLEYLSIEENAIEGLASETRLSEFEIERTLATHRVSCVDGGIAELHRRSTERILISGENRLAHTLLALITSMGFGESTIISRGHNGDRITPRDISGLTTRLSDVGKLRKDFHREIAHGASQITSQPDLIISNVPVAWDYVQRWMSEDSRHLHINPAVGRYLEIGPLVIPGKTPCLRCVALTKRDLAIPTQAEALRSELPTRSIALVAALVAAEVATYFADGSSTLLGASAWIDLIDPLTPPEIRYWQFHTECGCN